MFFNFDCFLDDGNHFLSCKRPKDPSQFGNVLINIKTKSLPPVKTGTFKIQYKIRSMNLPKQFKTNFLMFQDTF